MLRHRGASLLELMVAASLGLMIVAALHQLWAWQQWQQQQAVVSSRSLLTAQSLVQQLMSDIANTAPSQVVLSSTCFLLPQHDGRLLAYRVNAGQLQRHTLAPHCPRSGWQSLSHFTRLAVDDLSMQLTQQDTLALLSFTLLAKHPDADQYHAFHRELVLTQEANHDDNG